jgi:DNA-binding CsgD family transcriptional regulator
MYQPTSSDPKGANPGSRHRRVVERYRRECGLSSRETQVILLASLGRNCKEIAADLGCRPPTIDIYWTRIYRKTGCRSHLEVLAALLHISISESPGDERGERGNG